MKKYYGTSKNITSFVVGKITNKPVWFNRKNYVLLTNDKKIPKGYAAIITNNKPSCSAKSKVLCNFNEKIEKFNDGDIILIKPGGEASVLFDANSKHNFLMITSSCNCSCIMCPQPQIADEKDRTNINLKLISLIDKQTKSLGITGGEPTLIGNKLLNIIYNCKKRLPNTALTLLTNGIRFENIEYAGSIASISHKYLLIDVPLHSDIDTIHNLIAGTNGFYKTIKGIYNLATFGQKIGIRVVISKINYKRLPELAEYIYRNFPFVFHVVFMQMETIGLAAENMEKTWIDPHDYISELESAVIKLHQRDIHISIYNAQLCVLSPKLWKFARKSISDWKRSYIGECSKCSQKDNCGGFFVSNLDKHSEYIKPIKDFV